MKSISAAESLCPVCLKKIDAEYVAENNNVYMKKECPEHGLFKTIVWRDAELYHEWQRHCTHAEKDETKSAQAKGCPYDCGLCSEHEGGTCTAVLEITYRCNMDCPVCFADTARESFEPDLTMIREMYNTVLNNGGPCSIQLSGGEPTVRNDLPEIIRMGKEMGFGHIQINTNGVRIAEDTGYLRMLEENGADLIYLQFDGLNDDIYEAIRGRKMLDTKLQAIENCRAVNIGVLLVPTIIPKINLDHIGKIIDFAKGQIPIVKGIHFQPVSYFGRFPQSSRENGTQSDPKDDDRITLADIVKGIETQTGGEILLRNIIPRKRFDSHCAFSSLFYLQENGRLLAVTNNETESNPTTTKENFVAKANKYTKEHWQLAKPEDDKSEKNQGSAMDRFAKRLKDYTLSITGMHFQDVWNIDLGRLKGCCVQVISSKAQAIPLCAFHLTSIKGERLYRNE